MIGAMKFKCKTDEEAKTLLTLYILHTLRKKPKSGYEILSEIKMKTDGKWVPSKGTLYPLLKKLEREQFIAPQSVGKRSKKVFTLTQKGEQFLIEFKKMKNEALRKFTAIRKLIHEVVGEDEIAGRIGQIWELAITLAPKNRRKTLQILDECIAGLEGGEK
ncbi:MAG: PadR family transcriptional regulator [Thermoplasmata archaeon]|nr:PadR family transcriptional regulator [Thermoplasmata archaeon]